MTLLVFCLEIPYIFIDQHIFFNMKQILAIALFVVALNCLTTCSAHDQLTNAVTLKFSFCGRDLIRFESLGIYVAWNGATVFDYIPTDYDIHHVAIKLQARVGQNTLNFAGAGVSDALGMTIDNVRIERECGCGFENLVVNGEFHEAVWVDQGQRYFYEGIRGWRAEQLEVGNGRSYNRRLPQNNPVIELDASKNSDIVQTIYLDDSYRRVFWYPGTPSVLG